MNNKVIIPFKCSQCGAEFSETDGGLCYFCNKVFCRIHLLTVFSGKKYIKYVCLECKNKYINRKFEKED
jgi:DNA-directed RNA polymerase subunit RPC12/RpoP